MKCMCGAADIDSERKTEGDRRREGAKEDKRDREKRRERTSKVKRNQMPARLIKVCTNIMYRC